MAAKGSAQRFVEHLGVAVTAVLALGATLEAIQAARLLSIFGAGLVSLALLAGATVVWTIVRVRRVRWTTRKGEAVTATRLGSQFGAAVAGMLVLIWAPQVVETRRQEQPSSNAVAPLPTTIPSNPISPPAPASNTDDLDGRLDQLSRQYEEVEALLASLEDGSRRAPDTELPTDGDGAVETYELPAGLKVLPEAAGRGKYGLRVTPGRMQPAYVETDTPRNEATYSVRFLLNTDNLGLPVNARLVVFGAYDASRRPVLRLQVISTAQASRCLVLNAENDDGSTSSGPVVPLGGGWEEIAIGWHNGSVGHHGTARLWVNGASRASLDYLVSTSHIEYARLGSIEPPHVPVAGFLDVDELESWRLAAPPPRGAPPEGSMNPAGAQ
jgi:hypothetical protein